MYALRLYRAENFELAILARLSRKSHGVHSLFQGFKDRPGVDGVESPRGQTLLHPGLAFRW
jgi:hypothetical protein